MNPVIGGENQGNRFENNRAPGGMDICVIDNVVMVPATYNTFRGVAESDYYVSPAGNFDLTGCVSETVPLTQDLYVSPQGDDLNTGTSLSAPLKTVNEAYRKILGTSAAPRTVHLDAGVFSPTLTGEQFPLAMVRFVSLSGSGFLDSILDAEGSGPVVSGYYDTDVLINHLQIRGADGPGMMIQGGTPEISHCTFTENQGDEYGGGVFCTDSASPLFDSCRFESNVAMNGAALASLDAAPVLFNCLFAGNNAYRGGALYLSEGSAALAHCTFSENSAGSVGGGFYCKNADVEMTGSILWKDSPEEIFHVGDSAFNITHSDVETSGEPYPGNANINENPAFAQGPRGGFYLSRIPAGQFSDSPCIDTGENLAADTCSPGTYPGCLVGMVTSTANLTDNGTADMGYHHPVYTGTGYCDTPTVELWMPTNYFKPGMTCSLSAYVCFPAGETENMHLFVVLDLSGTYYFAPSFSEFDSYSINPVQGGTVQDVLPVFAWPDNVGTLTGVKFLGALTDAGITGLTSNLDIWEFGWGY